MLSPQRDIDGPRTCLLISGLEWIANKSVRSSSVAASIASIAACWGLESVDIGPPETALGVELRGER